MSLAVLSSYGFNHARTPAAARLVAGVDFGDPELHHHHQSMRLAPSYA